MTAREWEVLFLSLIEVGLRTYCEISIAAKQKHFIYKRLKGSELKFEEFHYILQLSLKFPFSSHLKQMMMITNETSFPVSVSICLYSPWHTATERRCVENRGAQNIQNGCRLFMFINTCNGYNWRLLRSQFVDSEGRGQCGLFHID